MGRVLLQRAAVALFFWILVSLVAAGESPDDSTTVAAYAVVRGQLVPDGPLTVSKADQAAQSAIWKAVTALVPADLLKLVSRLEFLQNPESASETETDGWALQSEDSQSFTLGLNLTNATAAFVDKDPDSRPAFQQTIIHEFGHVLSFRASQMDEAAMETLQIDEGTLKSDAYLNVFYQKFWKSVYPNHGTAATSDDEGTKLYLTAPTSFVSEYAATGPLEDFAETFAWFVTHDKPKGKAVLDQKIALFFTWPELVSFREQFRRGL
jgi:hypothetical protein